MQDLLDISGPFAPTDSPLRAALWAEVQKAILIGDLYAGDLEAHDFALDLGAELAEFAERLEEPAADSDLILRSRAALVRAADGLAELAPLG